MKDQYSSGHAKLYHEDITKDWTDNNNLKLKTVFLDRAGIKNPQNWEILDVGCGSGVQDRFLTETFPQIKSITGIDLSPDLINIAKKETDDSRINYIVTSMDNLPITNGKFDFVFSINVIHYSSDLVRTFREINRVMKKGSTMYFFDTHPIYSLFLKKNKNYELKEDVDYPVQGSKSFVTHPSFTIGEYVGAILKSGFRITSFKEYFGRNSQVGDFRVPVIQEWILIKD